MALVMFGASQLRMLRDSVRVTLELGLAPLVYFTLLIKLGGFSAQEWAGLRKLLRRRQAVT